ncbi:uridine kinase family protein [Paenibacillus solani]|uniref:uridine kinase family protein n=1 Tax=Paenibacillus solani TaxID=1705565 RepID=UPI003D2BDCDE
MEYNQTLTIGIGGGSGSGKTTLSLQLKQKLSMYRVEIFHMDRYYKPERPIAKAPFTNQLFEDFNHPDAVHIQRLIEDVGKAVHSGEHDVVIIEGFLLYQFEQLRKLLQLKVFIDCPADERMIRRNRRFTEKGHSEQEVLQEYLQLVRYRHDEFVEPTRWYADVVLNGSIEGNLGCAVVTEWILARIQENRIQT